MKIDTLKVIAPVAVFAACLASARNAAAQAFIPGNVLVSGSFYQDTGDAANLVAGQTVLPTTTSSGGPITANANGSFPNVFNNDQVDSSFGVTSPIFLQQMTSGGSVVNTINVNSSQITTSFPSKSELGLSLSPDGTTVTFMGYVAPAGKIDVSNANTPNHVDPTNPDAQTFQRAVGQLDALGNVTVTSVNDYSGNNGRNAILVNNVNGVSGQNNLYMVGNAGNGSGTEPDNIVKNTGVQMTTPGGNAETTVIGQHQGTVGAANGSQYGYSVTQNGATADKSGKDDNFRGMTIYNNTMYVTKGSGNNGINTVYQVGTAGSLPTASTASSTTISILPGFNTVLAKNGTGSSSYHPFGLFFANGQTLYVADEGDGVLANAGTANDPNAGLEKWSLVNGTWVKDYTLTLGLGLGVNYASSETGYNANNLVTDGLRNIAGMVNADGTVTLYGITSTASDTTGDQGADPNKVVTITDTLADTTAGQASGESFTTLETASAGEVFRGVAAVPTPEPSTVALSAAAGFALLIARFMRRKSAI